MAQNENSLVDKFGRTVDYVRLSVTDRCDFRCVYCMTEDMTFLPRKQILSLEEIYQIALAFTELGVKKIRLTGGEPMVRSDVMSLIGKLGSLRLRDFARFFSFTRNFIPLNLSETRTLSHCSSVKVVLYLASKYVTYSVKESQRRR